jgi:tetratricopeptide (TPR) repeat protein
MLGDDDLLTAGLDASAPETPSASTLDDAEDEVVVLDLESDATELPFAVDTSTVLPQRPPDEPTLELEIDLDELELGGFDPGELEAEGEEPEIDDRPAVDAVAGQADEAIEIVGDLESTSSGETEELPEPAELAEIEAAEGATEAESLGEIMAIEDVAEIEPGDAVGTAEAAMPDEDLAGSESVGVEEEPVLEAPLPSDALVGSSSAELLSEARVLVTYGLDSKAVELCERALEIDPKSAGGWGLLVDILHDSGQSELAAEHAERARAALGEGDGQWIEIKGRLIDCGYLVSKARVASPEQALPATEPLIEVEPPTFEPPTIEQASPGWLEVDASTEQSFAQEDEIFGSEDEFFDLAAELEQELRRDEEELSGEFVPQLEEQSLEEIVEGFKRGVAETLSQEDYETHYNLGIAYREMGLLDEAIGEFQLAAKAPAYLVDCCSLLGACFLEKGFPDLAIKWFERGLESPQVTENESLGLLYELGNLYLITGDKDVARKTFADIYGVNSNYRDVVAKLEELKVT